MREILTILASLLIVVLTAALVGPWFVDWTAHRGWVESELSRVTGARVHVAGNIDLKLLPVPRLEMSSVHVSSTRPEGPLLDVDGVKLELAVEALIRGELRFTEAVLSKPQLSLVRKAGGALVLPRTPNFKASGVQVERLSVTEGSLALRPEGGGTPFVLGGLEFLGEASTLAGPFRGAGQVHIGGVAAKYRFSTAAIEKDHIRLKAILDEGPLTPRGDIDGSLVFTQGADGTKLSFEGAAAFSAVSQVAGASVPWRLSGTIKADSSRAVLDPAELRAGDEDRALLANGSAELVFGASPHGVLTLAARQLDIDKLLADESGTAGSGARFAALVGSTFSDAGLGARLPLPLTISLTSPTAALAGETLTEVRAELGLQFGKPLRVKVSANGPARSSLSLDGAVEAGRAAAFRGRVDLGSRDVPRFAEWLSASTPDLAARLRDLPFRSLNVAGDVEASAGGVIGRDLAIQADRSQFAGTIAFTRAMGSERARLFGDLTSDALDLDGIPELAGPARFAADMDLSLSLDARAVRLARFGEGVVDAGHIGFKLLKDAGNLKLERFSVANIGGASLSASGQVGDGTATLEAKLDAARLGDLAALLRRVAPGQAADALAARAVALSPARLNLSARGTVGDAGLQLEDLKVEGTARGTKISMLAQPSAKTLDLAATFENPDGPMLLRQIGLDVVPLTGTGAGRLRIQAKGSGAGGYDAAIEGRAAGSSLTFKGRLDGSLAVPLADGDLSLRSSDATPLLRVLELALPDVTTSLDASVDAHLALSTDRMRLEEIGGRVAGASFAGHIERLRSGTRPQFTGSLRTERLSLPILAALALGPVPEVGRRGRWPDTPFAPGLADAPPASIGLRIQSLGLMGGKTGEDASLTLGLAPGLVVLDDVTMRLGAGSATGQLTIRRNGKTASLAGRIGLVDQPLPSGPASGQMSGQFDFTSTGQSFAALASGLAGTGALAIHDLTIGKADPGALLRVVEAADRGGLDIDEAEMRSRLGYELDRRSLDLGDRQFDATLAAGVLRLEPRVPPDAPARFSAAVDLRDMAADARLALTAPTQPKDWTGPRPALALVWHGQFGAMSRYLDAGPLINAISARAIAREAERVEALESDIRERAAFNRRLKAQEFIRRREAEVKSYLEEKRKEDERRAAEVAKQKADEEQRAAKAAAEAAAAAAKKSAEEAQRQKLQEDVRKILGGGADPIGNLIGTPEAAQSARDQAARDKAEQEKAAQQKAADEKAAKDRAERERRARRAAEMRRRATEAGRAPRPPLNIAPQSPGFIWPN